MGSRFLRAQEGTSILLVGSNASSLARIIRAAPQPEGESRLSLTRTSSLSTASKVAGLTAFKAAVVELDGSLSEALTTLGDFARRAPELPLVVIAEDADPGARGRALAAGARDYLDKSRLDHTTLLQSIRGAVAREERTDASLHDQELARATVNSIGDALVTSDRSGTISFMNRAAEQLLGASGGHWKGQSFEALFKIIDGATRTPMANPFEEAMRTQRVARNTSDGILVRRDGQEIPIGSSAAPIHDQSGNTVGAVLVLHDVSESRAVADHLLHLAQHDSLTNLPNRLLLNDRLTQGITLAARYGRRLAVLFLDLDRFKHINDSLGHLVGDTLLKEVAGRLLSCVRKSDTVSRQGGDEFIVLLSEVGHAEDAALAAEKMRHAVMAPFLIADHQVHLSVSIGISVYPEDGQEAGALIRSADIAMYHAKDRGRNNIQFFEDEMNARNVHRQAMEDALGNALRQGQFVLHYQPIVDLKSGLVVGAESLVRWKHPDKGLMFPDAFIAIAEEAGLIESIGNWVLRESCVQARAWIDARLPFRKISVNVSALEFNSQGFLDRVSAILDETGLEPHYLEIEITETAAMRDVAATSLVLEALKTRGVHFAMDDFGTGYSSLSNLMLFPIDTLKIDKSFVMDVKSNDDAATIVSAVISLGQSLRLRIVAEGIETAEQLVFLQSRACTEGQGYYFSKPIAAEEFQILMEDEPKK